MVVYGEGHLDVSFLRGLMRAEGMGYGRRWVRWVRWGTGTASGHAVVSLKDALSISAGRLFRKGAARLVKANWRRC